MLEQTQSSKKNGAELVGDLHPLTEQIGSAAGLTEMNAAAGLTHAAPITTLPALRQFLQSYQQHILFPIEWPAICQAYQHAAQFEVRELIDLDVQLSQQPPLKPFATASQTIGRHQLKRLRPLRDQRVVQRYLQAVESKKAPASHTVVFGMILSLYSLPLRQGLMHYAEQTLRGFIYSANRSLNLTEAQCEALYQELSQPLPAKVEAVLSQNSGGLRLLS